MNIVIIWPGTFPSTMAVGNRYAALAKGLLAQGENVNVLCLDPSLSRSGKEKDLLPRGVYDGIPYSFPGGRVYAAGFRVSRIILRIYAFMKGLQALHSLKMRNQLDIVMFSRVSSWKVTLLVIFGAIYKVKLVHERNEHPFVDASGGFLRRLDILLYLSIITRFCDGLVVISHPLRKFFSSRMNHHVPILVIPAIVDTSRFEPCANSLTSPIKGKYLAWCGSLWGRKDGVGQLVEAFIGLAKRHREIKLVLIAPIDESPEFLEIKRMIEENNTQDRIVMTGQIGSAQIPQYLANASILVLARPSSIQAEHGFPTKLPEYLATGVPVVATIVGDIPRYLTNGLNSFLVAPDDPAALAAKLEHVLMHPEEARKAGAQGMLLTQSEFSHVVQCKRFASFLYAVALKKNHRTGMRWKHHWMKRRD
jgi:glycosyltransferase involved in cell wall biosynthesis